MSGRGQARVGLHERKMSADKARRGNTGIEELRLRKERAERSDRAWSALFKDIGPRYALWTDGQRRAVRGE